jgi:hypothetical protein
VQVARGGDEDAVEPVGVLQELIGAGIDAYVVGQPPLAEAPAGTVRVGVGRRGNANVRADTLKSGQESRGTVAQSDHS